MKKSVGSIIAAIGIILMSVMFNVMSTAPKTIKNPKNPGLNKHAKKVKHSHKARKLKKAKQSQKNISPTLQE